MASEVAESDLAAGRVYPPHRDPGRRLWCCSSLFELRPDSLRLEQKDR